MSTRPLPRVLAVLAATSLLAGCGLLPGAGGASPSPRTGTASSASHTASTSGGDHIRHGWVTATSNRITLNAHRIERYPTYSVLYMDLTPGANHGTLSFGDDDPWGGDFADFNLLDPLGGKYYHPLRAGDSKGLAFGSRADHSKDPYLTSGVRHPLMVYFPPVPADVRRLTVLAPGTLGELTGIPVVNGPSDKPALPQETTTEPKAGQPFHYQVTPPSGKVWSRVEDLHSYRESRDRTVSTGSGQEKLALRADVLFAFDKATLSGKATKVLNHAISETRAEADPAKPPISITGYTDAKGSDAYNIRLSRKRANAVERYLSKRLGDAYKYRTMGKGEADPVAPNTKSDGSDNPEGRAKNRRVTISYRVKQHKPSTETSTSAAPGRGAVGEPATFRTSDGPVIGSVHLRRAGSKWRLDVHPFYRDGRYLVGVFNAHHESGMGDGLTISVDGHPVQSEMSGAEFRAVIAADPVRKVDYYEVRVGALTGASTRFANGTVAGEADSADNRFYIYYPAPPATTTKMNLRVGTAGTVRGVPIR